MRPSVCQRPPSRMWTLLATACLLAGATADDSLRSALHAVQKRQRDLSPPEPLYFNRPNMIYSEGQPEDIGYGYQKSVSGTPGLFEAIPIPVSALGASFDTSKPIPGYFIDDKYDLPSSKRSIFRERGDSADALQRIYSEEDQPDDDGPLLIPSPFRERMSEKSRLQNAHALVRNFGGLNREQEDQLGEDDYINVLNSIWEKYKNEEDPEDITEADVEDILEYLARKEEKKRQQFSGYDFFNSPLAWAKREPRMDAHHKRYQETLFDERYPYRGPQKRFPITKRSPTVISSNSVSHRHKKNTPEKQQTDPKVAAELNNIFSPPQKVDKNNHTELTTTTQAPNTTQTPGQKEQPSDNSSLKPLEVKKKSINWSDYFGIDRRKKSADSEINNEWLARKYLEKYGYMVKDKDQLGMEKQKKRPDDVDNKMRAMEDLIVDQAIKYTGAHEGATDTKEIQQVKDKVMAQLAAAYSLEKMRRALGEFKASIAAQRASAPPSHGVVMPKPADQEFKSKMLIKEKPAAVSGKMEKKEVPEIRNEVAVVGNMHGRECPVLQGVEMRCKEVASMAGDRSEIFLPLCNLHHMCYLCGAVLRAASPRECDTAFLEETESVCRDEPSCYYIARRTLSVARSLKPDPNLICDWRNSPCLAQFLSLTTEKR